MEFSMDESPAVKALGPLFKLSEVHLWDDGSTEIREFPYSLETANFEFNHNLYKDREYRRLTGFCSLIEDVELTQELNDLGLPLSFHTNKEKRYGMTMGKRKSRRKNNEHQQSPAETGHYLEDSLDVNDGSGSPVTSLNASHIQENLECGIAPDEGCLVDPELVDPACFTACAGTFGNGEASDPLSSHSPDCQSESSNDIIDKFELTRCTNEMASLALCLDVGNSEERDLRKEGIDCEEREIKEEMDSVHLESFMQMEHETEGETNDISSVVTRDSNIGTDTCFSEVTICNTDENHPQGNSGEWIAYWDDFYMRTYFYNLKTEESTWDPPPGMEHLVHDNIVDEKTHIVDELAELDSGQTGLESDVHFSNDLQHCLDLAEEPVECNGFSSELFEETQEISADNVSSIKTTKRKKRERRKNSNQNLSVFNEDHQGVVQEFMPSISKYWCQRHLLFSRFDEGIKMDEEGWFSVTPEPIAKHHAIRCGNGSIVDFFTGAGGNAIQFAQWSKHVIAIDIDPNKIDYAQHNATIYGVNDSIDFIKGDSFSLAPMLKADTVFMSPPWGGPDYSKVKKFDINTMLKPHNGQFLFNAGKEIAPKIVMFLPRNIDINQLAELALSATPPWSLEVERNFWNGRLKAVTAYFSEPFMS